MARRVTIEDKKKINELYYQCHNYAEVARQTGWSASTVRSYVDPNYKPAIEVQIHRFDPLTEMKPFDESIFDNVENYGDLCVLSDEEKEEMKVLWEELAL